MGIAYTIPTQQFPNMGTGETGVQPAELWGIPDNGAQWHSYFSYTTTTTGRMDFADETAHAVVANYTWSSAYNSVNAYTTANCNGVNAHDTKMQINTAGGTGSLYTTFTGVPYARVSGWSGSSVAKHPLHSADRTSWPRGVYVWNGTGLGGVQH